MEEFIKYFAPYNSILLLGFGREGKSSYRLLRKHFPLKKIGIADRNESIKNENIHLSAGENLKFHTGPGYLEQIHTYDMVLKSPGVKLSRRHMQRIKHLSSQTDLFLNFYHKQCIGVTGTKGKSTTASLIAHILKENGRDVFLVGNIGVPPFDFIEKAGNKSTFVFELSSHQLLDVKHAPHIAILLNLYDEHLDFYDSPEDYFRAKLNIFHYQDRHDFAILNRDDHRIQQFLKEIHFFSTKLEISAKMKVEKGCYARKGKIVLASKHTATAFPTNATGKNLPGQHNLYNLMAAVAACSLCGLEKVMISSALHTFKGLPHRLEYAGEFEGIHFYNDSIATIPEATMAALKAIPNVDSILLGGFDRGLDYEGLSEFLAGTSISSFIFLGPAGKRIRSILGNKIDGRLFFDASNMIDAVRCAKSNTRKGFACLLSPAAASYDSYKSFEDRGLDFMKEAERSS